jgi:hypothetical protein
MNRNPVYPAPDPRGPATLKNRLFMIIKYRHSKMPCNTPSGAFRPQCPRDRGRLSSRKSGSPADRQTDRPMEMAPQRVGIIQNAAENGRACSAASPAALVNLFCPATGKRPGSNSLPVLPDACHLCGYRLGAPNSAGRVWRASASSTALIMPLSSGPKKAAATSTYSVTTTRAGTSARLRSS